MYRYYVTIGLLFIIGSIVSVTGSKSTAQQQEDAILRSVNASDVRKSVKIIGRLGKPMTEPVAIKGHWIDHFGSKGAPYVFRVTMVAGKQLDKPVDFNQLVVSKSRCCSCYGRGFSSRRDMDMRGHRTWTVSKYHRAELALVL